ncbi:MAG: TMEM165/GDT1 family protein [Oligoflexales bacterium]
MDALIQSFGLVLISEMGDKTQLLALILALRFKKPWTVMAGILVATIFNHGLASLAGGWVGSQISEQTLRIALAVIFFAFALWMLVPDKLEDDKLQASEQTNPFLATLVLFFLAEMGDKTQLATVALGAKFETPLTVTLGTTMGMLVADGIAVAFGEKLTAAVPMKVIRLISAISFAGFGLRIII